MPRSRMPACRSGVSTVAVEAFVNNASEADAEKIRSIVLASL